VVSHSGFAWLLCCGGLLLGAACAPGAALERPVDTPIPQASVLSQQRDSNVPELPFPDNPDPNQCGIPMPWSDYTGWVNGTYQGQLVQPTVLLYDSHLRLHVTGAVPTGTSVRVQLYQANPVLDFYYVRAETPSGPQQGWVPAPFLQLNQP
jgi:hypothetical protein